MVQLRGVLWYKLGGFFGTIQWISSTHLGFSVHFIWFLSNVFWEFFEYPPGVSGVREPRQGVRCILRTVTPPPPPNPTMVCSGLLLVHLGGPFGQISGMEVGEVMEGHGTTCDCTLTVVFFTLLFVCVLQGNVGGPVFFF